MAGAVLVLSSVETQFVTRGVPGFSGWNHHFWRGVSPAICKLGLISMGSTLGRDSLKENHQLEEIWE